MYNLKENTERSRLRIVTFLHLNHQQRIAGVFYSKIMCYYFKVELPFLHIADSKIQVSRQDNKMLTSEQIHKV